MKTNKTRPFFLCKIKNDGHFGIKFFLLCSLIFNCAYALFLLIISLLYRSRRFLATSVYYGLLSVARIFLFFQMLRPKTTEEKTRIMRACGYFLFLLNVAVATITFILIYTDRQMKYPKITVIGLATYTFFLLSFAIVSGIKYFKKKDGVYSCIKAISLISASVSMVTLTDTMLATFGEGNERLRSIVLPVLSGAVSLFIISVAVFMIKKANSYLRTLKNEEERK